MCSNPFAIGPANGGVSRDSGIRWCRECSAGVIYLDTSALVKHYIDEGDNGTPVMDTLIASADDWGGLFSARC
jgi:hypothetical protein